MCCQVHAFCLVFTICLAGQWHTQCFYLPDLLVYDQIRSLYKGEWVLYPMAVRPYEREEMGLVRDILYLHLVSKEYVPNNLKPHQYGNSFKWPQPFTCPFHKCVKSHHPHFQSGRQKDCNSASKDKKRLDKKTAVKLRVTTTVQKLRERRQHMKDPTCSEEPEEYDALLVIQKGSQMISAPNWRVCHTHTHTFSPWNLSH